MRTAILGLGHMGKCHARVLRELGHEVVTVDPAGHADYTAIPKRDFADGACIATSPDQLFSAVRACEDHDLPICLIEKPLGQTLGEASTIAVRHPGTWVGYVERFNPMLAEVERLLPRIGQVRRIVIKRLGLEQRNKLGPWRDLATHDLDLLDALRLPEDRAEIEVGYGVTKERAWCIEGEFGGSIEVDWMRRVVRCGDYRHFDAVAEPLKLQWHSLIKGDPAPVDTRGAVQVLRSAIRHEQEHEPVAA